VLRPEAVLETWGCNYSDTTANPGTHAIGKHCKKYICFKIFRYMEQTKISIWDTAKTGRLWGIFLRNYCFYGSNGEK
jgi:hypothetical protein